MSGGIDINKLSGDIQAFARAADQDKDITAEGYDRLNTQYEISLFKELVTGAGLQDELSQQLPNAKVGQMPSEESSDVKKQTDYKKLFGDKDGSLKQFEQDINKDVINFFKQNKGSVDPNAMRRVIAARPDVTKYQGMDKEIARRQFEADLKQWKSDVENCKIVSTNDTVKSVGEDIRTDIKSTIEKFAEQLNAAIENGNAKIIGEIGKAKDGIIKAVQTAEGHIIRVVVNQANKIIRVVENEADLIHMHMDYNTGIVIDHTTNLAGIVMDNDNNNTEAIMKNDDLNAEDIKNRSDSNHARTQGTIKQEGLYDTLSDQFNANINRNGRIHKDSTTKRLQEMFTEVRTSEKLSDEAKTNLLIDMTNYTRANDVFNERELDDLRAKIDNAYNE